MASKAVKEMNLGILVKNGGFDFTETFFPYTSGQIGPYYVQSAVVMKSGEDFARAIVGMRGEILGVFGSNSGENIDVVSGGERRDWIFSGPIAHDLQKPYAMICKDGSVIGADMDGKKVVHVADLNNEGASPKNLWVPTIKNAGGTIDHIFFYVDRMEDGVGVMKDLGLQPHAVVPLDVGAWDYLRKENIVSELAYKNLRERGENKESRGAWAREMLRSDSGFARFARLYEDPATKAKAEKIIDVGYTDMRAEMLERLAA